MRHIRWSIFLMSTIMITLTLSSCGVWYSGSYGSPRTPMPAPSGPIPVLPSRLGPILGHRPYNAHLYAGLQYFTGRPINGFYFAIREQPNAVVPVWGARLPGNARVLGTIRTGVGGWVVPPYRCGWALGLGSIGTWDTPKSIELMLGHDAVYWIWQYRPRGHRALIASGRLADGLLTVPRAPGRCIEIQYVVHEISVANNGMPGNLYESSNIWVYEPAKPIVVLEQFKEAGRL